MPLVQNVKRTMTARRLLQLIEVAAETSRCPNLFLAALAVFVSASITFIVKAVVGFFHALTGIS